MSPSSRVSWLRVARERHNLSLRELAELANVAPGTICKIETGTIRNPQPATKRALSDALGYDVEELFHPSGRSKNRELQEWAKALYGGQR